MRSSRSLTARAISPCRAVLISAKVWSRPFNSASSAASRLRLAPPAPHMHDERDCEREQREGGEPRKREGDMHRVECDVPNMYGFVGHNLAT